MKQENKALIFHVTGQDFRFLLLFIFKKYLQNED